VTPKDTQDAREPAQPRDDSPDFQLDETILGRPDTPAGPTAPPSQTANVQGWVGKSLGKYQILAVLGQGGMGVVLKAHDPMIERDVAIKVLGDHLAADDTALGRFLAEAKAAGKLNHPNVMAIYEICQEEKTHYLVLEYVPGGSLDDRLGGEKALPLLEATQALIDACKGVGAAHAAGLIHRDIKPANFMRAADGSIKVADFGLAKGAADSRRQFTQTGMVVGTPFFMSPEQCEAKPVDHRSDVYSLGATYYTLLTGKYPYHDTEIISQVMFKHCFGPVPDPRAINPAVPEACARIVARAMAKAPAERYQSTAEMLNDLQAVAATLSGQNPIVLPSDSRLAQPAIAAAPPAAGRPRNRRLVWAAGGVIGLALALGAVMLWRPWQQVPNAGGPAGPGDMGSALPPLTATAPGVTATDITLGLSAPFSGPSRELGRGIQVGIETYFQHVNETMHGVHLRKLKLLALDDGYDPQRCAETMQEMLGPRPVFAFLGNVGTPTAEVSVPLVNAHKRVLFGAFSGAALLRRDPPDRYVFN
jgi:hypothetical protein